MMEGFENSQVQGLGKAMMYVETASSRPMGVVSYQVM
jgi:hypothetical protein